MKLKLSGLYAAIFVISIITIGCQGDDSSDVSSWKHPEGLTDFISPTGDECSIPSAAMDNDGNSIVTWAQRTGTATHVFASEYRNGKWHHPSDSNDYIDFPYYNGGRPVLAMGGNGDAVIAWPQENMTSNVRSMISCTYREGTWFYPLGLDAGFPLQGCTDALDQEVAINSDGDTILAWASNNDAELCLYRITYMDNEYSIPVNAMNYFNKTAPGAGVIGQPSISIGGDGRALITWRQTFNSAIRLYKSEMRCGYWTDPISLDEYISKDYNTDVTSSDCARDASGNAIVAWTQVADTGIQAFIREYRDNRWDRVITPISFQGYNAENIRVAMASNGEAVIVWNLRVSSTRHVLVSEYRGGRWKHPVKLSEHINARGGECGIPDLAVNSTGDTIIAWEQDDGTTTRIYTSEYRNGSWVHPLDINDCISPSDKPAVSPSVAINDSGESIIAWKQNDGTTDRVYLSEYR